MFPSSQHSIRPLVNLSTGNPTSNNSEKAELLNNFFGSQSNLDDTAKLVPNISTAPDEHCLTSVRLTQREVEEILKTLPIANASGPDGISNRVLREASHEPSIPLCALFNHSLTSCVVPDIWKEAHVSAFFIKGRASLPRNYHPKHCLTQLTKCSKEQSSSIFATIFILATFSLPCNKGVFLETLWSTSYHCCILRFASRWTMDYMSEQSFFI